MPISSRNSIIAVIGAYINDFVNESMKLPRVSTFIYKDVKRVVIEHGPDKRGCGLFTTQLVPEVGPRTFKTEKMFDCKKLGIIKTLWYLARSARFQIG